MASDGEGLFAQATGVKRKSEEENAEKRRLLRRYDHLAVQALNPFGVSEIDRATLSQLWEIICNGNKATSYFAEWPDKDIYRKGIAISRLAQVLVNAIEVLEDEKFARLLDKNTMKMACEEGKKLLPALRTLNGGKASQTVRKVTLGTLGVKAEPGRPEQEVEQAAKVLYEWISKQQSTLRALLSFLSQGGVFYAAACADKAARAYAKCSSEDETVFIQAAKARLCSGKKDKEEDAPDDQACLFAVSKTKS